MVAAGAKQGHHIPGYTGFLPGSQHQMAKTYGQSSASCIEERQANDDPLKWRKFVSYAEFTPPHTPTEGHHIPGYSGHVPGVYAENLYAKTYGKTTLQAVEGDFPKGCEQAPEEQYKTSNQDLLDQDGSAHPGRPTDILPGGASWSGASPYNVEEPYDLEALNPYPPSVVQIAGGKEPTQTSILLKNFPPTGETKEPALRIQPKTDPHDPTSFDQKRLSTTSGHFKVPGYSGFVPGTTSENLICQTYARTTAAADRIRDRKKQSEVHLKVENINTDGVLPLNPAKDPPLTSGDMPTTATDGPTPFTKHIPGYTGYVPGVGAENLYGKTYGHASHIAMAGDHTRFQWREMTPAQRFSSSQKDEMVDFGHVAKVDDGHITYAHNTTNPARANYKSIERPILNEHKYHIAGYGGFVPQIQSKNMYGLTQFDATSTALSNFAEKQAKYEASKPKLALAEHPTGEHADETSGLGMLQFKPKGFAYQKRMQGDWNNGQMGSRNYSAVRLAEGRHWKGNLYTTTNKELMKGHQNSDIPVIFSKGPKPTFENMQHGLAHKSVYLGYYEN